MEKKQHSKKLPDPQKVIWKAKVADPEAPGTGMYLAYIRLIEVDADTVSIDAFYGAYTGVNLVCPMDVAKDVIDRLVNDPWGGEDHNGDPFYFYDPYVQYIKYDFADFY